MYAIQENSTHKSTLFPIYLKFDGLDGSIHRSRLNSKVVKIIGTYEFSYSGSDNTLHNLHRIVVDQCMDTSVFNRCSSEILELDLRLLSDFVCRDVRVSRSVQNKDR